MSGQAVYETVYETAVYETARVTRVDVDATALLFDDGVVVGSGSVPISRVGRSSVSTER